MIKVNDFIEANKNGNYKIRLLEREVPNIGELVKKLTKTIDDETTNK